MVSDHLSEGEVYNRRVMASRQPQSQPISRFSETDLYIFWARSIFKLIDRLILDKGYWSEMFGNREPNGVEIEAILPEREHRPLGSIWQECADAVGIRG